MKRKIFKVLRPIAKKVVPWLAWVWIKGRSLAATGSTRPNVVVLSVGSIGHSAIAAREARAQGYKVHAFCHEVPFREARHIDFWHRLDCRTDFDKALETARKLNPRAILVAEKNLLLPMQAHLADGLGLRSVGEKAAKTSNSKIALREALDEAGVPNLPWCRLADFEPGKVDMPLVLKPDLGTASKGVRFVTTQEELEIDPDYAARMDDDASVGGELMLEAYVEGRQFDFEGLARDGEYHLLTIVEEMYQDSPPYFPPSWFLFNPPIPDELRKRLVDTVFSGLKALGVQNGSWHCEARVDKDGVVRILDYANRMGYNQLVSVANDVSFAGSYVALMCDPDFQLPQPKPKSLMRFMSRNEKQTSAMARLRRENPDIAILPSFIPFEFSYHQYLSIMGILQPDFASQVALLRKYDLLPSKWDEFYDMPAQGVS